MNAAQPSNLWLSRLDDVVRGDSLATPSMGLFTGNPVLSNETLLADLALLEPGFTGYARSALTLNAKRRNAAGDYIQAYSPGNFQPTAGGGTLPETVTGYFIVATIGGTPTLLLSEFLATPYTFVDALSALAVTFDAYIKNLPVYGGQCSAC